MFCVATFVCAAPFLQAHRRRRGKRGGVRNRRRQAGRDLASDAARAPQTVGEPARLEEASATAPGLHAVRCHRGKRGGARARPPSSNRFGGYAGVPLPLVEAGAFQQQQHAVLSARCASEEPASYKLVWTSSGYYVNKARKLDDAFLLAALVACGPRRFCRVGAPGLLV